MCAGIHAEYEGNKNRMLGLNETSSYDKFTSGVSDRSASVRIPRQAVEDECGYLEDRRPNANGDPYVIAMLMIDTVCSAASTII